MSARAWYRFQNAAEKKPKYAELFIYDYIGQSWWNDDAVTAKKFVDDLNALPESVMTLRTRVNSLGGSVFDAVAITNAMRAWAKDGRTVETQVDGIAASAASVVIMAGSSIRIGDNAMVMVHNPLTIALGNSKDFRKVADDLDAIRGTILASYRWHSTLSDDEIVALMDAETWMDADDAIAKGFATEKIAGLQVAASLDLRGLELKVPDQYKARVSALLKPEEAPVNKPQPSAAADVMARCAEAQLDLAFAKSLIDANATADEVTSRITAEKDTRAKAKARSDEITLLCDKAKQPELAAGYIAGAMSVDAVRNHLTVITAKMDKAAIDSNLDPNADPGAKKNELDPAAIFAARKPQKKD